MSYQSIRLTVNGAVNLQVRGGSAGVVESFYGVIKPIPIVKKVVDIRSSGKFGSGITEIPFSVTLKDPKEENLEKFYDTYHGSNISIQYLVTVDIARGYLHKSLSATTEFIVESERDNLPQKPVSPEMIKFYITQDTQKHTLLPELKSGGLRVTGKICTQCSLLDPLGGELTVETSAMPIQSIDIHLLRVESILIGDKISTESTLMPTLFLDYAIFDRVQVQHRHYIPVRSIEEKQENSRPKRSKSMGGNGKCVVRTGPHNVRKFNKLQE